MKKASVARVRVSKFPALSRFSRVSMAVAVGVLLTAGTLTHVVQADEYDEKDPGPAVRKCLSPVHC